MRNIKPYRKKVCRALIYAIRYYGSERVDILSLNEGSEYYLLIHYPEIEMHTVKDPSIKHTIKDMYVLFKINSDGNICFPKGFRTTITVEEYYSGFIFPHLSQYINKNTIGDFCLGDDSPMEGHFNSLYREINEGKEVSEEWFITLFTLLDQYLTLETNNSAYCRISSLTNKEDKLIPVYEYMRNSSFSIKGLNHLLTEKKELVANILCMLYKYCKPLFRYKRINQKGIYYTSLINYPFEKVFSIITDVLFNRLYLVEKDSAEYNFIKGVLCTYVESEDKLYKLRRANNEGGNYSEFTFEYKENKLYFKNKELRFKVDISNKDKLKYNEVVLADVEFVSNILYFYNLTFFIDSFNPIIENINNLGYDDVYCKVYNLLKNNNYLIPKSEI